MTLEFCFLLNVILLSRLSFTFVDVPISRRRAAVMGAIVLAGLLAYRIDLAWAALTGLLLLVQVFSLRFEKRGGKTYQTRLLAALAQVLAVSVIASPGVGLRFQPALSGWLGSLAEYSVLLPASGGTDWLRVNVILLGLLLVTNEANLLIRYVFRVTHLSPRTEVTGKRGKGGKKTRIDVRALNAGRIIGILERLLIYILVLNAQFAAIGFILAAKSFTRYKELEKRAFAEYVLVGTLLSALLATLAAAAVGLYLK
jgi:hypothetical protein